MTPLNLGIELDQGADFSLVIGIAGENGPVDLSGYSFKSEMRTSTDPDAEVVAEFQFQILDQVSKKGQVRWYLPEVDDDEEAIPTSVSYALEKARRTTPFVFDVKMKDTANIITRIIQGIVYVSPQATQEAFT